MGNTGNQGERKQSLPQWIPKGEVLTFPLSSKVRKSRTTNRITVLGRKQNLHLYYTLSFLTLDSFFKRHQIKVE